MDICVMIQANKEAIAIAGKTRPTKGTKTEGKLRVVIEWDIFFYLPNFTKIRISSFILFFIFYLVDRGFLINNQEYRKRGGFSGTFDSLYD
ncbi:hypothetical protein L6452_45634 [Arctium lappa]|nr:hypothetical protein L6452_45634 [Arctium lappa]